MASKQAPRTWYSRIISLDFKKSLSESILYVKENNNEILVVSLYVDDLLITGSSAKLIDEFKLDMMQVFEMTDLGLMTYFLGMEIKQGKDQVFFARENTQRRFSRSSKWKIAKK